MKTLKTAYELANDRTVLPKHDSRKLDRNNPYGFIYTNNKYDEEYDDAFIEKIHKTGRIEKDPPDMISPKDIQDNLQVYWEGQFFDYGGFARMNRAMAFGLANRNVRVRTDVIPSTFENINAETRKEIERMSKVKLDKEAPKVYGTTVPLQMNHGGKRIIYTMIESSEKAHPDYINKLNTANEVWVASDYSAKVLKNSGITTKVLVMPLGVDESRYTPVQKSQLEAGMKLNGFVFLSVFKWSFRKGYDILLKAFLEEFSQKDDVSLLILSRSLMNADPVMGKKEIADDFVSISREVIGTRTFSDLPHVALCTKDIPEKDMPKYYQISDAFCMISRGEGMGLPYLEAGACGLPVIASHCSGQSDFLNNNNSFLVEPNGYVKANITSDYSKLAKQCHFYNDQMFPVFGPEAIEQTKAHMRYVFNHSEEARNRGSRLRTDILNKYTWDKAVDRVYFRIKEIQ